MACQSKSQSLPPQIKIYYTVFFCLCLMIAFITTQINNTARVNVPYTKMLEYQGADCMPDSQT